MALEDTEVALANRFAGELKRRPKPGDVVPLGPIALVAHRVTGGRLASVGLRLAQEDEPPATLAARFKKTARDLWSRLGRSIRTALSLRARGYARALRPAAA